jgi:predicted Zn-dependent protease
MMRIARALASVLALALAATSLAGCEVNPATGRTSFTGLMSPAEEARVGAEQHPEVIREFGGVYADPALGGYVAGIGQRLAAASEQPNLHWTFTILNNDIVNAFSLPGGYVYVTRGLLALAENEAELAGVMAHEIGHVTARHVAERYTQAQLANVGVLGVGILTGSQGIASGGGAVASAALQSFSRDQEFEADSLGVRYLIRAGYDPNAMASFLRKLEADSALEAQLAGLPGTGDDVDIMSTHPRTADRVGRAVQAAGGRPPGTPDARVGGRDYLRHNDGLYIDGDPQNGIIKNRRFIHPALRFAFDVPPGFRLVNGEEQVLARGPNRSLILFTLDHRGGAADAATYLQRVWAPRVAFHNLERIAVNGLDGATASVRSQTSSGQVDLRLVALRGDGGTVYRLVFLSDAADTARLSEGFRRTTYSFTRLTPAQAAAARPYRLRIVAVKPGDTVESLARRMPYDDFRLERFRTLNGLNPGERVRPSQLVKLVGD